LHAFAVAFAAASDLAHDNRVTRTGRANRTADIGAGQRNPTAIGVVAASTSDSLSRMVEVEIFIRGARGKFLMLHYAIVFFVIALIAALFGFGGIAAGAAGIAKILFVVFLIGAVVALLVGPRRI
jgi:uncharacterized membrane protein YtjA (UPF0391 family)